MSTTNIDYKKYISYLLILYTLSFPISKAATNLFEVLAIVLWLFEGEYKTKLKLYKNNLLTLAIALLLSFSLLSILWHDNAISTLNYIAKYHHLLIIFVFYSSFEKKYTPHILSAFLAAIFISELISYGIFFELIHYKNISPSDPTPFMSHMTYSTVLAFAVTLLLVRLYYETKLRYKFIYALFFLTATTNLFINGGKTGQIIFILLILLTTIYTTKNKLKAIFFSTFIIVLTFSLAYTFSPNFQRRSSQLYNGIIQMVQHNNYDDVGGRRVALSLIGLETINHNLLLGTGVSYHMPNAQQYAKKHDIKLNNLKGYSDYHNTFITISAQLGLGGIFISLLIIYALFTLKIVQKEYKLLSLLFATAFVVFSFTHNTLHTMNPMIFFALFAGLFSALSRYKEGIKDE